MEQVNLICPLCVPECNNIFQPVTSNFEENITYVEYLTGILKKLNETIKQVNINTIDIAELKKRVAKIEDEIVKIKERVTSLEERMTQAETLLQQLTSRIVTLEQELATAKANIASLTQRMTNAEAKIVELDTDTQANSGMIDNLTADVKKLQDNETLYSIPVAELSWQEAPEKDPFAFKTKPIFVTNVVQDASAIIRLMNHDPILFAKYGFMIGEAISDVHGVQVVFLALEKPEQAVNLKLILRSKINVN